MRRATMRWSSTAGLGALICLVMAAGVLAAPAVSIAEVKHNSVLVHVGSHGLVSYNAWTKKSKVLVNGMIGTWFYPVLSPNGISAVTITNTRSDRAYCTNMYASLVSTSAVPFELTVPDADDGVGMTGFRGWLDDYRAVFDQPDPTDPYTGDDVTIVRDTRDPANWSYYSGSVTYPSTGRKRTAGDKKYTIKVSSKNWMTVRVRKTKKRIAHFKLPGSYNGSSAKARWYLDSSISPDGTFVAYELAQMPYNDSRVTWRTYVCTLHGHHAVRLYNGDGGFVWR